MLEKSQGNGDWLSIQQETVITLRYKYKFLMAMEGFPR